MDSLHPAWPVDPHLYLAFLGVMTVMALTPGPAVLFAVATGIERGRAAALVAVAGMNGATLVWFGAAALGLGAVMKAFPDAFRLIAYLGAGYVVWLGAMSIRNALKTTPVVADPATLDSGPARPPKGRGVLLGGFMVQAANPKLMLFFVSVLPPFLDPARPAAAQLALFAVGTIGLDALAMAGYGVGGAALARRMTRPGFKRGFGVATGLMLFLAAGLIVARL